MASTLAFAATIILVIVMLIVIMFLTVKVTGKIVKVEKIESSSMKRGRRSRIALTVTYTRKNGTKRTIKIQKRHGAHKVGDTIQVRVFRMYA